MNMLKHFRISNDFPEEYNSQARDNKPKVHTKDKREVAISNENYANNEAIINAAYIENSPAVKQTNAYIFEAIELGASDIHFEPFEDYVTIRFRMDGILYEKHKTNTTLYNSIITRLKVLSKMNIAERRTPQDGSFQICHNNKNYDFRVSTLPTLHGEKLVLRILYKSESSRGFDEVHKIIEENTNIKNMLKHNHGIILITGPTGSGKSTTLYTMIDKLNTSEKNIITIEDPIEYEIKGINQVSVNPKSGVTFESGLRSILRQDPDIIMIGEIRDSITAEISIRAACTGHLVLSTLHTNDASSSISRLIDMGVPRYLIADSLIGVMAQRLVRVLCSHCKEQVISSRYGVYKVSEKENCKLFTKKGCKYCGNTGYSGRTIVYELLSLDIDSKRLIACNDGTEAIKHSCIRRGMIPLEQHCFQLFKDGITSYEEYERVCYSLGSNLEVGLNA